MKTTNKILKNILLCTVLGTAVCSCDLDVVPPASISAETYWKTEKDAWYNLNAIYSNSIPGIAIYADSYTDDVLCQYAWESNGMMFQQDGLNSEKDEGWNFETIRKQNIFLQEVENCNMSEDLRDRFKAEVRTMRAWSYLGMTLTFGKVPIITTVPEYNAENVARDEVSKVHEFILAELTEAAKILPEKYTGGYLNEKGRITKWAALALKARAALYFGDYKLAETTAKDIMDHGGFSLFRITSLNEAQQKEADEMDVFVDFAKYGINKDDFTKGMFSYEALWHTENANPDNPEYIMTRQYTSAGWDYQDMVRYTSMRPDQLGGWSSVTPTQNLVDAYWVTDGKTVPNTPTIEERTAAYKEIRKAADDYIKDTEGTYTKFVAEKIKNGELKNYKYIQEFRNRDSRLYTSIMIPFKSWYETDYGTNFIYEWKKGGNNESSSGFNFRKMLCTENDPEGNGQAVGDYPCIRYAEILLIFAEAHTQTTSFDGETQAALNELRDRCGMPKVPTGLNKDEGLKFIRKERRIEMAGEGFRSDDMTRYTDEYWKEHMNGVAMTMPDGTVKLTMKWSSRMRLKPIPQAAIDLNPLLKGDQNAGYN